MAYEIPKDMAIANIVRVELETEETTPKQYRLIDVASEADVTAFVSEGEQKELRVKNVIKAQNNMEDIVKGYDIRLLSATLAAEILALVDGGTLRFDDIEVTKVVGYDAPAIGEVIERQPFTLKIYTEEKDADGSTISYVCFKFLHCKGTPVNYRMQDGEFFAPEMLIRSRPKKGESPASVDFIDALPA